MEQISKLADLALVSKHCPVANFSYPRNEAHDKTDRSSLGSEGSAPGLIDDRSESEVSIDDDYHTHADELWDSFWARENRKKEEREVNLKEQYPALIPSPQRRRKNWFDQDVTKNSPGWPLTNIKVPLHQRRNRQPAAMYSPFPKPIILPPPGKASPSWQSSRSRDQPQRPKRPTSKLLEPCVQTASPVTSVFTVNLESPTSSRPLTPAYATRHLRSPTLIEPARPRTAIESRPPTPFDERENPFTFYSFTSRSATNLPLPDPPKQYASLLNTKTSSPCPSMHTPDVFSTPPTTPHSVFEYDSSDSEDEIGKSFFRFQKRSTSDLRRSVRTSASDAQLRRRPGANTNSSASLDVTPVTPVPSPSERPEKPEKRRAARLGRMLGRTK